MIDKRLYQFTKPQGQETRGKTARNRLRRVDNFLLIYAESLLRKSFEHHYNVFVDVGYGQYPFTTLESAQRFRCVNRNLHIVGIEIDKERVANANSYKKSYIDFRHGGFNLPLIKEKERATVIRAFNVLRQYKKEQVLAAYNAMLPHLVEGGVIIEGTSDPLGRIWVANLFRKHKNCLEQEAVIFSTNFRCEFFPQDFQTVLPKNYIERMVKGDYMYDFFQTWKFAYQQSVYLRKWGDNQVFKKSIALLAEQGYPVSTCKKYTSRGYLVLYINDHLFE